MKSLRQLQTANAKISAQEWLGSGVGWGFSAPKEENKLNSNSSTYNICYGLKCRNSKSQYANDWKTSQIRKFQSQQTKNWGHHCPVLPYHHQTEIKFSAHEFNASGKNFAKRPRTLPEQRYVTPPRQNKTYFETNYSVTPLTGHCHPI